MPGEVRLHRTIRNPEIWRGTTAEAPEGGTPSTLPFRCPKPHCCQLGERLFCTHSLNNEERTVQAVWSGLWAVWLSQTWQRAPPVDHDEPKAWAPHCVWSPHLNYLRTASICLQIPIYDAVCFICFVHTSSERSACWYYLSFHIWSTKALCYLSLFSPS